jgi:hypothetical protein
MNEQTNDNKKETDSMTCFVEFHKCWNWYAEANFQEKEPGSWQIKWIFTLNSCLSPHIQMLIMFPN